MTTLRKWAALSAVALLTVMVLTGCSGPKANQRLTIEITTPSARATVTDPEILVSGVVSDAKATLNVNDTAVTLSSDGAFNHTIRLAYGSNRISLRVEKEGMSPTNRSLTVTRALTLAVNSPEKNTETSEKLVTVSGTISDSTARVTITGTEVPVGEDGSFSMDVPLYYLETLINVTAHVAETEPVTETITVVRTEV